jgi:MtN3 and saliva related transmembrane protein
VIDIFGYIAGTLTTLAFLPQTLKIIRDKTVEGISLTMYLVFGSGVAFWLIYGILINNLPIIIFNVITLAFAIAIIANIFKYKK